jgi:hypothetical protein
MRILFLHHFPLDHSQAGRLVRRWGVGLTHAGHDVRCLVADEQRRGVDLLPTERVVCRLGDPAADVPLPLPQFSALARDARDIKFSALTDPQLALYRNQLRRRIDGQIDRFDPHVVHVQHVWVLGQLALETGVPYVLNAWPEELADYARDRRYQALADQAAENAGRILVADEAMSQRVGRTFESAAERTMVMPADLNAETPANDNAGVDALVAIYQSVLDERFGRTHS